MSHRTVRCPSTRPPRPAARSVLGALVLAAATLGGCAAPDLDEARAAVAAEAPPFPYGDVPRALKLRRDHELSSARALALRLAKEHPDDPDALLAASVCESDALAFLPADATAERAAAAWSALDFAERAVRASGDPPADALAQLARAIGGTIHLRSMFARADAARQTSAAVEAALARDPEHADARSTRATLRLRLATLPWIAGLFAGDVPEASLEGALADAEAACARAPSVENRILLAKVLDASGRPDDARAVREEARAAPDAYPRDPALRAGLDG